MSQERSPSEKSPIHSDRLTQRIERLVPGTTEAIAMNDAIQLGRVLADTETYPFIIQLMRTSAIERIEERINDRKAKLPEYGFMYEQAKKMLKAACAEELGMITPPKLPRSRRRQDAAIKSFFGGAEKDFYKDVAHQIDTVLTKPPATND